jgi:beta-mannosidase
VLDEMKKTTGFRSVKLIQEPLDEPDHYGKGTSFLFEINGVRIFIGGSNWIPADNFLTTISDDRYRAWLQLLRDGNQNMVRIWGGGIYEPDIFYDICDELGILVWQDFQFACGVYPAHPSFLSTVRAEALSNVTRLRSHPSIALFCGNNEDYQMVLQWGDVPHLPAVKIYEEILPEIVSSLTTEPEVPYWRGSPYGGKDWDTADPTVGDVHQWNVWGGKELPYQNYDVLGGRFVSEFGMPGMPAWKTIQYWMDGADEKEWYHQSPLIAQHCRAGLFERRFSIPMNENFRVTEDLETCVLLRSIFTA